MDAPAADAERFEDDGEDDEGQQETPVQVKQVFAITGGGLSLGKGSRTWLPEVVCVNGMEFIKLSKWCPMLTRFCTGKARVMHLKRARHETHSINVQFFEDATELRWKACNEAVRNMIVSNAEADGQEPPQKIRPAVQQDEWLVDRTVTLHLPAVSPEVPARNINFLWAVKGVLHMELTSENLEYVRHAIMNSPRVVKVKAKAPTSPKRRRKRLKKRDSEVEEPNPGVPAEGELLQEEPEDSVPAGEQD